MTKGPAEMFILGGILITLCGMICHRTIFQLYCSETGYLEHHGFALDNPNVN